MKKLMTIFACSTVLLSACNGANDAAEDRMEDAAEASAAAAGPVPAALGLTEAQLIDAELVGANGVELGDVQSLLRDANGQVDRLLVEIEDSDPDRFVEVPVEGLSTIMRGDDTDLSTTMTREQLAALPDATLPVP